VVGDATGVDLAAVDFGGERRMLEVAVVARRFDLDVVVVVVQKGGCARRGVEPSENVRVALLPRDASGLGAVRGEALHEELAGREHGVGLPPATGDATERAELLDIAVKGGVDGIVYGLK